MPHIKGIRLVNVQFNNATQYYDDFHMAFNGKNATYNLENGGGKSVLFLMMLQTVLPKTYLRKEKPISLIFKGGRDRTSHVVVEWILDDGIGYKYMMTGFSARKKKENTERDSADEDGKNAQGSVDHINWCILYDDAQVTGIREIELLKKTQDGSYSVGFEDVRKIISQLQAKGLSAEVFEGIEKYKEAISGYNLNTAEWNIIKGINTGENSIESYFRQNGTSRKLIENHFVKIIEDVEAMPRKEGLPDESLLLADALIEIRGMLNDYLMKKDHLSEYENILKFYTEYSERNSEIKSAHNMAENCKRQAVSVRSLLQNQMAELSVVLSELTEEKHTLENQNREVERAKVLNDIGRIQHEILLMRRDLEALEVQCQRKQAAYTFAKDNYNRFVALEAYQEFRQLRMDIKTDRHSLDSIEANDDAKSKFTKTESALKYVAEKELQRLLEQKNNIEKSKNDAQAQKKENEKLKEDAVGERAILGNRLSNIQIEMKRISEESDRIRNMLLTIGEVSAVMDPIGYSQKYDTNTVELHGEIESTDATLHENDKKIQDNELSQGRIDLQIENENIRNNKLAEWFERYISTKTALFKRAQLAGCESIDEYRRKLESDIHAVTRQSVELEYQISRLRKKKNMSVERGYFVPNEEVFHLSEAISNKGSYVVTGIEWLSSLDAISKAEVVGKNPTLAYSVIVDEKLFERLKSGKEEISYNTDYVIPIISLEAVRRNEGIIGDSVFYHCGMLNQILSEEKYADFIASIDETVEKKNKEILDCEEYLQEYTKDLQAVEAFRTEYNDDVVDENAMQLTNLEKTVGALEQEKLNLVEEARLLQTSSQNLKNQRVASVEKRNGLIEVVKQLKSLSDQLEHLEALDTEKKEKDSQYRRAEDKVLSYGDLITESDELIKNLKAQMNEIESQKDDILSILNNLENVCSTQSELLWEDARSEYEAAKIVLSGKNAEASIIRERIIQNDKRSKDIRERIERDNEIDLSSYEEKEHAGETVIIPTSFEIKEARVQFNECNTALSKSIDEQKAQELKIEKRNGGLNQLLQSNPDLLESEAPVYADINTYDQKTSDFKQLMHGFKIKISSVDEQIERVMIRQESVNGQHIRFDEFVKAEGLPMNGPCESIVVDYAIFSRMYQEKKTDLAALITKWDTRKIEIQEQTKRYLIIEPINELCDISAPNSFDRCRMLENAFNECVANISEQIQKIDKDIQALENYQRDFSRRCIQRAEVVLGHLKKLESLSRIEVHGTKRNMIELKLHEFDEGEKKLRMQCYIDSLVSDIDKATSIERKLIASKLATKELLAQIIDMGRAQVYLYKIESIPENSKPYRWEEAVGSDGQNNSLYFVFAVCLISFIRALSITNTSAETKKVIFADNPFGATSAIYLWDPMFKIMERNGFQMISPSHRADREITSRFGVNYILNQEIMKDGRTRVVIKDVRTETDDDLINYLDIGDQLSMLN